MSLNNAFIPEIYVFLESVLNLCVEIDERSLRIFPSFRLSKIKFDIDEEENSTSLKIDQPTPTAVTVVALQLAVRLTKLKSYASNAEIFKPIAAIIREIPFDDDLKVTTFVYHICDFSKIFRVFLDD